jgi:hypothetical protein
MHLTLLTGKTRGGKTIDRYQNGLPNDLDAGLGRERLDGVERQVGPGAGAVEVEVELARHFVPLPFVGLVVATSRAYFANP